MEDEMKRLIGVLLAVLFCFSFSNCGRKEQSPPPPPEEPTVDVAGAPSEKTQAYVVDKMDDGYTMGSVIDGKYYLSAAGSHNYSFTNFRRGAASLEAKGWVLVSGSFRGSIGNDCLFTGTFAPSDRRVAPVEGGEVPTGLILDNN